MLHLLLSRDWTAGRDEVLTRIAKDVKERKPGRILMVPELISHETERRLCSAAGDTASRYAEVLSFTRLGRRVSDTMGSAARECLDAGGRLVAMAAAARQMSSRLKAYASVETRPEFLTGLIDGVDEFKRCCITPQDLMAASAEAEGSLAQKLEELSLLMEGYDALCSQGKRDPRDQMTWVLEQMEEGTFGREHVFYIDGFPDFTRQHMAILEHLIRVSPSVTVSLNCDKIDSSLLAFEKAGNTAAQILKIAKHAGVEVQVEKIPERQDRLMPVRKFLFQGNLTEGEASKCLETFHAETPWQECMTAAQHILELVQGGCRYRDITVAATDMGTYLPLASLIFRRMHIPLYQSGTEEILDKSVISTVLNALDAALSGFDQSSVLRYLRTALSPLSPDLCDQVENYAVIWGIRGRKWLNPWENHPEGLSGQWDDPSRKLLAGLNDARDLAMAPLTALQQGFQKARNLRQQVLALYDFLEDIHLEERLSELASEMDDRGDNRGAQILGQLWEILVSALEQMYDVLGETVWDSDHFTRLLRLLLSQYDVGTIPPVLDAVQIGPVTAMRCHQEKYLVVLGAQEGNLPGYTGSSGVLTDQERVALRELGVPLTGGAMEGIQEEFAEIYGVFCGATEGIRVSYSGDQPSFVFRRLGALSGGIREAEDVYHFAQADPEEAGSWLSGWNAKEIADRLGVLSSFSGTAERRNYSLGTVERKNIEGLYGKTLNLSASQIDRQAECRLSYFLQYGLRARERKEASVDPAEFGTYVHSVLENTARDIQQMGGFPKVSLEQTLSIAHRYSDEYARLRFSQIESQRLTYLFNRNARELDMVVQELWLELKDALFAPAAFELGFGKDADLPAIAVPSSGMSAQIRGFVDRVDTWTANAASYYRVVDYKTGKKDFDYCDVFNGVGLQMLLYLFALRHSGWDLLGNHSVAAGVQYFPARAPYLPSDGRLDKEEAEKARESQWKRKGLLLNDEAVLQAMEPGENPSRMCYCYKKDGTLSGDLADRDQLKKLEQYVFRTLARMVEDIASGNVEPNPYTRGAAHDACAFCPYGSICHRESVEGRRNYKAMNAQKFWEEIDKEAQKHG